MRPDKNERSHSVLIEWTRQNFIDDFSIKELGEIDKSDGFVRIPSHTNYKPKIGGYYNKYFQISHIPQKGECPTILQILNHVFQDKIDFGLDYFKLLYEHPNQNLPVLVFESTPKGTGKSTVGDLLCLLFQENAVQLGNKDFESDFSGFWLDKLCIIVDETSLKKDGIMQTIKRLSTANGKVVSNEKNKAQSQIDFYGKFIFMSNDEGTALPIEKGEDRFAVFKVPTFESVGLKKIPNVEKLIIEEIPAFIYFLLKREMVYKKNKGRMYFDFEVYKTDQLMLYFNNAVSPTAREIKELIKDTFQIATYENELHFSVANIEDELKRSVKNINRDMIKKAMLNELQIGLNPRGRYSYYSRILSERSVDDLPKVTPQNNTFYTFKRENF